MIDPMVSLAFAVYSNKGAYALLLGSGVSRASGIPTGWEVIVDLVKKVAKVENEDCEPDPAAWYRKKYGSEPDYSKLLDEVAKTPTERQQLLRGYFEPNDDERAEGLKSPSAAHKAIAQLAAKGYVKVVVTTNFDRLMERALEEVGISPMVISSPDQIAGALPLTHAGVTVVKIHGDYLDTRIKNTESELEVYDDSTNKLLDRIFDEYGIIISGWSGDWDKALRAAIERCPTRRFTTFWTTRSPLSERAQKLVELRRATKISVDTADFFFGKVLEKVLALEDVSAPHPLSAKMAIAIAKRYIVDPVSRIKLHDLVFEETEKLYASLITTELKEDFNELNQQVIGQRLTKYESLAENLMALHGIIAYWGDREQTGILEKSMARIFSTAGDVGLTRCIKLRRYPAMLLLYAAGISAFAARRFDNLGRLLRVGLREQNKKMPLVEMLCPWILMAEGVGDFIPGQHRQRTPVNNHLFERLRWFVNPYVSSLEDYQEVFDDFECLLGAVYADTVRQEHKGTWVGPPGCFVWRGGHFNRTPAMVRVEKALQEEGDKWGPLQSGLFDGSLDQAQTAVKKFDGYIGLVQNEWHFR